MATGTISEQAEQQPAASANAQRYHDYIEQQLDKTGSYVRTVDIAAAVTTLLIGVFGVMLVAAVVDHWLVPGGLGGFGRWLFFLALAGGTCYYAVRFVLPLLVRRINPLYAARALEQSEPTLKNSLINFLMLRGTPQNVRAGVFRAVESRAARDLTHVSVDTAVDRSHLIKLGYVLVGLLVAFAVYVFISPKNPLPSIGRVMIPWSDIDRPSRVEFEDTKHTPAEVFRGQHLTVSTLVHGLDEDEQVTLRWSTADGQIADEPLVMYQEKDDARHRCTIPANDENGLRQDISYWIAAGDAQTSRVEVPVLEELFINVDEVRYEYPAYTGKQPTTQPHGDIRAVEGTTVTLVATANQPIRDAHLDFDCDGTMDELASQIDDRRAEFRFPLQLGGRDRQIEKSTYWVRFFTEQDRENTKPVKQRIEVLPDWPPEVNLVAPTKTKLEIPPQGKVPLRLRARDNDYGLSQISFVVEQNSQRLATAPLLAKKDQPLLGDEWHERSWTFEAAKYKLQPGDVVQLFAEVTDNKQPRGQVRTSRQKIEVTIVEPPQQNGSQAADGKQPNKPNDQNPNNENPNNGNPQNGDQPNQGDQPKDPQNKAEPMEGGQGENGGMQNSGEGEKGNQEKGNNDQSGMDGNPMNGGEQDMNSEGMNGGQQGDKGQAKPKDGMNSGQGDSEGSGEKSNDPNAQPKDGEPGESDGMGGGSPQKRPVNPNDDRDVIDEITRHREEQRDGSDGGMQSKSKQDNGMSGETGTDQSSGTGDKPKDMNNSEQKPEGMAAGDGSNKQPGDAKSQDGMSGEKQSGEKMGDPMNGEKQGGAGGMNPMNGDQKPQSMNEDGMKSDGGMNPKDKPQGSPMSDTAGNSGGMKPDEKNPMSEGMDGMPPAQGDASQKSERDGMGEQKNNGNVDQKKKGQGSQADDEGHGKAKGEGTGGDSTAKDQGTGKAEEEGQGETSDMAGDDQRSDGETGMSDESMMGDGTKREGTGEKPGGKPSKDQDGGNSMGSKPEGDSDSQTLGEGTSEKSAKPQQNNKPNGSGGNQEGRPHQDDSSPPRLEDDTPQPDAARRDYARKKTELALDHLKEELAKNDSDLFDKDGGLTREQAEAWAERMQRILDDAKKSGDKGEAKKKLDQTLDNLGIRPQRTTVGRGKTSDEFRDVRRGADIPPPPGYEEHHRAFRKGLSESER